MLCFQFENTKLFGVYANAKIDESLKVQNI